MSKLPEAHRFVDLSDYGRPVARWIARSLQFTTVTPVQVTIAFIITGLIAVACMIFGYYWSVLVLLIAKSILDAADGELARVKETPSYTGRYLDSIADILLNALIFMTLWYLTDSYLITALVAFCALQLQGTLYNYYYVILRNRCSGDTTSRIVEDHAPEALPGEKQGIVTLFYHIYNGLYILFDKTIYNLDPNAAEGHILPNWFMTVLSSMGLGFQLLIIGLMMALGLKAYILLFFISYSLLVFILIGIRRTIY